VANKSIGEQEGLISDAFFLAKVCEGAYEAIIGSM
jgi:hypothetical protein